MKVIWLCTILPRYTKLEFTVRRPLNHIGRDNITMCDISIAWEAEVQL
jgi:hypothetical protein